MAVADADTESLPHYDVEITPISSVNYEELKKATVNALNQFQIECKTKLPDEFTNYLNALMGEIESTHKAHEMHVVKASATTSNDTSEKLKNVTDVTHSGKRSLANAGQTCYMNSALQLEFYEYLLILSDIRVLLVKIVKSTIVRVLLLKSFRNVKNFFKSS